MILRNSPETSPYETFHGWSGALISVWLHAAGGGGQGCLPVLLGLTTATTELLLVQCVFNDRLRDGGYSCGLSRSSHQLVMEPTSTIVRFMFSWWHGEPTCRVVLTNAAPTLLACMKTWTASAGDVRSPASSTVALWTVDLVSRRASRPALF